MCAMHTKSFDKSESVLQNLQQLRKDLGVLSLPSEFIVRFDV